MVVDQPDLLDVHAVRLQIDPSVEVRVADARGRDGEGGVLDRDRAQRMWIVGRGCEPLHDPEIDRAAVDVQIDPILGRRRFMMGPRA